MWSISCYLSLSSASMLNEASSESLQARCTRRLFPARCRIRVSTTRDPPNGPAHFLLFHFFATVTTDLAPKLRLNSIMSGPRRLKLAKRVPLILCESATPSVPRT